MNLSQAKVAELVQRSVKACGYEKAPTEVKAFLDRLAKSSEFHFRLKKARLSEQQIHGLISKVVTLNMDYSVFQRSLDRATKDQAKVRKSAKALADALDRIYENPFITDELRYQHNLLKSIEINVTLRGGLDTVTPISNVIKGIATIARNSPPRKTDIVAAALSSRKKHKKFAPHQLANALSYSCPVELRKQLRPVIASVVSARYDINFRSDKVKTIFPDSPKK